MNSFESMKKRLEATGIYRIDSNSNVYKELCAYASGLDILRQELGEMERELFVSTAEGYGLERLEKLWGATRNDQPISKRREMIITRYTLSACDFTLQGVERILRLIGVSGTIEEFPSQMRLSVDLSPHDFTKGQRAFITNQIKELFPAHLDIDIVFKGLSWSYIDSLGLSFSELDSREYSWEAIDYLIGEIDNVII